MERNNSASGSSLNPLAPSFPFPCGKFSGIKQHYSNGGVPVHYSSSSPNFTRTFHDDPVIRHSHQIGSQIPPNYSGCGFSADSLDSAMSLLSLNYLNGFNPVAVEEPMFVNPVPEPLNQCLDHVRLIDKAMCESCSQELQISWSRGLTRTDEIFDGVIDFIVPLMNHQHGHVLFEMLIHRCSKDQLKKIAGTAIVQLLRSPTIRGYCSKSVGMLIKVLRDSELIEDIMDFFSSNFFKIMISLSGSILVLKFLDLLSPCKTELLYKAAIVNVLELAMHDKGILNLKSFINFSKGPGRRQLLHVIAQNTICLSQDPYGNFLLQHVLELHDPTFTAIICTHLKGNFVRFSIQKNGSRVVEKCLMSQEMESVVQEFIDSNYLQQVMRNQYGNYVIQTAIKVTKATESRLFMELVEKLLQHRSAMQKGCGRKVLNCLIAAGVRVDMCAS